MKTEMEKEADTEIRSKGLRQQAATTGQRQGLVGEWEPWACIPREMISPMIFE